MDGGSACDLRAAAASAYQARSSQAFAPPPHRPDARANAPSEREFHSLFPEQKEEFQNGGIRSGVSAESRVRQRVLVNLVGLDALSTRVAARSRVRHSLLPLIEQGGVTHWCRLRCDDGVASITVADPLRDVG